MPPGKHHEVTNLKRSPGELSFELRVDGRAQAIWFRTESDVTPNPEAALAACLMPAMREGGTLELSEPISPRVLRVQREFAAIQRAWSLEWTFGQAPLEEVEVVAPSRLPPPPRTAGRIAAFFSGGVDSWATVLANPDVTDLIFVRGFDLVPGAEHQAELGDEVEARLRAAADALGLPLHVVDTNLRALSDPLILWDNYYGCAVVAVAHFFAPLFERVLIAGDSDYEVQAKFGANWMVDQLWSSERLEIVDDGGRYSRMQRLARIAGHPVVRKTLRVCWENPGGAYNCGRCRKCLMTMSALEALGERARVETFPADLDLAAVAAVEVKQPVLLTLWEDVLDAARASGRVDLERAVGTVVFRSRRLLGLVPGYRRRKTPGPPATVGTAVVVPAWGQPQYLAAAVRSALAQEIDTGVGVVVVNDGCPDPETHRIGEALRDAHPDRVAYLRQPNGGLSAARNAGIRLAFARWPHIDAIFPLDADNLLSPRTLSDLAAVLEEHPEAAWATPTLEFFGAEEGEWRVPGPYLPYRQLFSNQCDAGSLIRREIFDAGIEFDETMRDGFEDWEFFLRATLAGFGGILAGRCGFRYRRRVNSMVTTALAQGEQLEASIRDRHPEAYAPAALLAREHVEAPRFALVRCDRDDVLLMASCDLEPNRLDLAEFARGVVAASETGAGPYHHIPAVTVLTSAAVIEWLEASGLLAEALFRLQSELSDRQSVELRLGGDSVAATGVRGSALELLPKLEPEGSVDLAAPGPAPAPPDLAAATVLLGAAGRSQKAPLPIVAHPYFLEHRHLDQRLTAYPGSGGQPQRAPA